MCMLCHPASPTRSHTTPTHPRTHPRSEFLVEVPYILGQSVIYSLLVYWMIGG